MADPFRWECPYCGHLTTITDPNFSDDFTLISTTQSVYERICLRHVAIACPNADCRQLTLRVVLCTAKYYTHLGSYQPVDELQEWQLLPESRAKPQPDFIPESIRRTYYEACRIVYLSPTASAALARRCLQGMIRDFWEIPEGKRGNLGAEISYIKDRVDPGTLQAIHDVRSIGDIGAHMDKYVDQIVDVESDEAELLVELIETLLEDWYIQRRERAERNTKLTGVVTAKRALQKANKTARKANASGNETDTDAAG